ncbi:MAG TPA: DUF3459 domain-containing protein, partial [Candidatus Dormibacteraeota bacterium]|nr:DUF3459 domain-containing protein [Candidatus Dormibacteraeota bacterium]
ADWRTRNVAVQAADPTSVLGTFRRLIAARAASPALGQGDFAWHVHGDGGVLAWWRRTGEERALVALNTTGEPAAIALPREGDPWRLAASTAGVEVRAGITGGLPLEPYEACFLLASS